MEFIHADRVSRWAAEDGGQDEGSIMECGGEGVTRKGKGAEERGEGKGMDRRWVGRGLYMEEYEMAERFLVHMGGEVRTENGRIYDGDGDPWEDQWTDPRWWRRERGEGV